MTRQRRAAARRRRRVALAVTIVVIALAGAVVYRSTTGGGPASAASAAAPTVPAARTSVHAAATARKVTRRRVVRLRESAAGHLPYAIEDAAAAAAPGRGIVLAGGLSAADLSLGEVVVARGGSSRTIGSLPNLQHDAPGVQIGGRLYTFGGGNGVAQLAGITGVDLATGRTAAAGTLPAPSSDSAAAALAGVAYVVGGYTGTAWLDTIVAWQPGGRAHVVARLPNPVRYAAVTFAHGLLVIAGGSLPDGSASRAVLTFDPRTHRVRTIARLPADTTHAAAATIGDIAYVIGGRGAALDTPSASIVAIDPVRRTLRGAGTLAVPRSDLAAVSTGSTILIAGGHTPTGVSASVAELRPVVTIRRTPSSARRLAATAVYAHDGAGMLTGAARLARPLIYVPNSQSNTVSVIDPATYRVISTFPVGALPQHVTPSWNLKTLYVDNDDGNSLTPIDPVTGRPKGAAIPVADPYNLYFTPNGRSAIVVAERLHRLDFRNPTSFALQRSLTVPCSGVDHMDFTANGRYALASCEFSGQLLQIDLLHRTIVRSIALHTGAMPQDVKLSPDGRVFYVADMMASGIWIVSATSFHVAGFVHTGAGAHGLYPSRDARYLYISNRSAGTISVMSFRTRRVVHTWVIPHGSPDMGGVSANGRVLWLSGRYNSEVYAINTRTGRLIARIPVGSGPHGLSVWPQPGRHSLGHTGILR